jgi:hypothetical protein
VRSFIDDGWAARVLKNGSANGDGKDRTWDDAIRARLTNNVFQTYCSSTRKMWK